MQEGYVYILFNSLHPDLVKIGRTTKTVEERVRKINSTGVPMPFVVAYKRRVKDCIYAENCIHNMLKSERKQFNKEFFKIPLAEAIHLTECIIVLKELQVESDELVSLDDQFKTGYLINSQTIENIFGKYKVDSYVKVLQDTRVKRYHIIYDTDLENNTCPLNFDERAFRCFAVDIDIEDWDIFYFEPYTNKYYILDSKPFSTSLKYTDNSIWGRFKPLIANIQRVLHSQ